MKTILIVFLIVFAAFLTISSTYINSPNGILKVKQLFVNNVEVIPTKYPVFNTVVIMNADTSTLTSTIYPVKTITLMKNKTTGDYSLYVKISLTGKKKFQKI